jgi:hypothetical protein
MAVDGYAAAPFAGQLSIDGPTALAKAVVLALALPVMLMAHSHLGTIPSCCGSQIDKGGQ